MNGSPPIPLVDLARAHRPIASEMREAIDGVIDAGDFVLGEDLGRFEEEFAHFVGARFCVGTGSGTASLTLALRACGIGAGAEVIVPAHTFIATALAVRHAGAEPVFCDVDADSGLIDLDSAAAVAGPKTAAIVPVHLYGRACDMDAVIAFAENRGLAVIEDAAQAHGASWRGRRTGSFGLAAAFSFYPSKNLGCLGDGGAVCTGDEAVAARLRELRDLGQRAKGEHARDGFNERLDTIQAAVLRVKLPHLERWNAERSEVARTYDERLPESLRPARDHDGADDVHHVYPVRVHDRDARLERMRGAGIGAAVHYPRAVHQQPPFRARSREGLGRAEDWAREELSLPIFPGLRSDEIDRICEALA